MPSQPHRHSSSPKRWASGDVRGSGPALCRLKGPTSSLSLLLLLFFSHHARAVQLSSETYSKTAARSPRTTAARRFPVTDVPPPRPRLLTLALAIRLAQLTLFPRHFANIDRLQSSTPVSTAAPLRGTVYQWKVPADGAANVELRGTGGRERVSGYRMIEMGSKSKQNLSMAAVVVGISWCNGKGSKSGRK